MFAVRTVESGPVWKPEDCCDSMSRRNPSCVEVGMHEGIASCNSWHRGTKLGFDVGALLVHGDARPTRRSCKNSPVHEIWCQVLMARGLDTCVHNTTSVPARVHDRTVLFTKTQQDAS